MRGLVISKVIAVLRAAPYASTVRRRPYGCATWTRETSQLPSVGARGAASIQKLLHCCKQARVRERRSELLNSARLTAALRSTQAVHDCRIARQSLMLGASRRARGSCAASCSTRRAWRRTLRSTRATWRCCATTARWPRRPRRRTCGTCPRTCARPRRPAAPPPLWATRGAVRALPQSLGFACLRAAAAPGGAASYAGNLGRGAGHAPGARVLACRRRAQFWGGVCDSAAELLKR